MKALKHGGNTLEISKKFNIDENKIIDFSTNINPLKIPKLLKKELKKGIKNLEKYPDNSFSKEKEALALLYNLKDECVLTGNGATEIIFLIIRALKPKNVLIPAPCFSEYQKACEVYDANVTHYEISEKNNFKLDVDHLILNITKETDMVFVCNPNNPTSQIVEKKDMLKLASFCKKNNTILVIDQAFSDFSQVDISLSDEILNYDNLIIIKALTKILAIPGLRVGYCLSNEKIINKMQQFKEPWTLNSLASIAIKTFPRLNKYLEKTKKWFSKEKDYLYNNLNKMPNIKVYPPNCNFILIKLLKYDANYVFEKMLDYNILIRNCSNFMYLNESYIRIAIKDRKSNKKLIFALNEVIDWTI